MFRVHIIKTVLYNTDISLADLQNVHIMLMFQKSMNCDYSQKHESYNFALPTFSFKLVLRFVQMCVETYKTDNVVVIVDFESSVSVHSIKGLLLLSRCQNMEEKKSGPGVLTPNSAIRYTSGHQMLYSRTYTATISLDLNNSTSILVDYRSGIMRERERSRLSERELQCQSTPFQEPFKRLVLTMYLSQNSWYELAPGENEVKPECREIRVQATKYELCSVYKLAATNLSNWYSMIGSRAQQNAHAESLENE